MQDDSYGSTIRQAMMRSMELPAVKKARRTAYHLKDDLSLFPLLMLMLTVCVLFWLALAGVLQVLRWI